MKQLIANVRSVIRVFVGVSLLVLLIYCTGVVLVIRQTAHHLLHGLDIASNAVEEWISSTTEK